MKFFIKFALVISLVTSGVIYSNKSQAFVGTGGAAGAALVTVAWIAGGLGAAAVGGALVAFVDDIILCDSFVCTVAKLGVYLTAGALFIAAIIALDNEGSYEIEKIPEEKKSYYGLSEEEFNSFNAEVPVLTAISQEVLHRLTLKLEKESKLTKKEQLDFVTLQIEEQSKKQLSPLALSALAKIRAKIINEIALKKQAS